MADIRHLENRQISTDFDEIWYINADLEFGDSHVTKYENFSYSRWRAAAILKSFFGHNSAADFSEILHHGEAVVHRISVMGHIPAFHRT